MSRKPSLPATRSRRTALRTIGGALALGIGVGTAGSAVADHGEDGEPANYAEVKFNPQRTDGRSVRVARYEPDGDGFVTIHTWDLIEEGNSFDTICGVSEPFGPGAYSNVEVPLFEEGSGYSSHAFDQSRLQEDQPLVAVPHRDVNHNGTFDFVAAAHDIPFTHGTHVRNDLPFPGAVNDWADVKVVADNGRRGGRSPD